MQTCKRMRRRCTRSARCMLDGRRPCRRYAAYYIYTLALCIALPSPTNTAPLIWLNKGQLRTRARTRPARLRPLRRIQTRRSQRRRTRPIRIQRIDQSVCQQREDPSQERHSTLVLTASFPVRITSAIIFFFFCSIFTLIY